LNRDVGHFSEIATTHPRENIIALYWVGLPCARVPQGCKNKMKLYRAIDVWKRMNERTTIRYRCFESLQSKQFCVQSADFYRLPLSEQMIANLARQFVELFIEQEPSDRGGEHRTLEEAIATHDRAFL
jgi:hypothetical protein